MIYTVTDQFGNISKKRFDKEPEFVSYLCDMRGMEFTGKTREDAEKAMVCYAEANTNYRGLLMVAKYIGYKVHGIMADGTRILIW